MEFPELPDWKISGEEVSAGVYNLRAIHTSSYSVGWKGTDLIAFVQKLEDISEQFKRYP